MSRRWLYRGSTSLTCEISRASSFAKVRRPRPTEPAPQKVTVGSGRKEEEEAHAREAAQKPAESEIEQGKGFICNLDVGAQGAFRPERGFCLLKGV